MGLARYSYDYRTVDNPLREFDTPEKVELMQLFTRKLSWWMGMSTTAGIKDVLTVLKSSPFLQRWLQQNVNPRSATLFYGGRWENDTPLPSVGSAFKRHRGILQWSYDEKKARWFAGMVPGTKREHDWTGGVLCRGHASGGQILLDIDALSMFLGKHRTAFEAMNPSSDALSILNGTQWEGEVLTTGAVRAVIIEAVSFPSR